MSIENNKLMNLADGKVLYDDLRGRIDAIPSPDYTEAVEDWLEENITNPDSPPLDRSLSSSSAAAPADIVGDLKNEIDDLVPIDLAKGTNYTTGKYVDYSTGDLSNSSSGRATDYIDISYCTKIIYTQLCRTASSSYWGIAFYNNNKVYISGIRSKINQSENSLQLAEATIPENAVYIRLSTFTTLGDVSVYDEADYNNKVYPRIEALETEVSEYSSQIANIDNHIENVNDNGYFVLPLDNWEVGSWQSYSSPTSSVTNRCRYKSQIKFNRDIYILADVGFMVGGYYSDGTAINNSSIVKIPKNQTFKIYVRRFTEVSETADVSIFANAVKFSTALAPIELYSPTFTDISMFERVGIGGDSYAGGGGWISGKTGLTWGKNLERQAGIIVDIYARSGENIIQWNSDDTKGLPALLAGNECGLYWLQHGINGTGTEEITGTPADMSADPHPNTFYGQYVEAIEQIQTTFPNAKIVLATICGSDWELAQNAQYSRANTAIKNIAEYCHVPCVDITKDDFFRSLFYKNGMQSNHPSAMVSAGMAMAHRRLLSKCIQENASYFLNYHEDPH